MSFSLVGTKGRSLTSFESTYIGGLRGALDGLVTRTEVAIDSDRDPRHSARLGSGCELSISQKDLGAASLGIPGGQTLEPSYDALCSQLRDGFRVYSVALG